MRGDGKKIYIKFDRFSVRRILIMEIWMSKMEGGEVHCSHFLQSHGNIPLENFRDSQFR